MKNHSKQIVIIGRSLLITLAGVLSLSSGEAFAQANTAAPIPYATEHVTDEGDSDAGIAGLHRDGVNAGTCVLRMGGSEDRIA